MYRYKWCFMTRIILKTHLLQNMPAVKKFWVRKRLSVANIRPKRWMLFHVCGWFMEDKKKTEEEKCVGISNLMEFALKANKIFSCREILENWYLNIVWNHYWCWMFRNKIHFQRYMIYNSWNDDNPHILSYSRINHHFIKLAWIAWNYHFKPIFALDDKSSHFNNGIR